MKKPWWRTREGPTATQLRQRALAETNGKGPYPGVGCTCGSRSMTADDHAETCPARQELR